MSPITSNLIEHKEETGLSEYSHKVGRIIKKASMHTVAVGVGISGLNIVSSFMGLCGSTFKAGHLGVALHSYKNKIIDLKKENPDDPRIQQCAERISYVKCELKTIEQDIKTYLRLAIPIVGPHVAYYHYLKQLNTDTCIDSFINFEKEDIIVDVIKALTFPLNGRYPLWAYGKERGRLVDTFDQEKIAKKRERLINRGGKTIELDVDNQTALEAVLLPSLMQHMNATGPIALLFHGPNMVLDDLEEWATFYQDRGINVLLITIRGYGNNKIDGFTPDENTILADAFTALKYVKNKLNFHHSQIVVHGLSTLGGKMATFLAACFAGIHLVIDQGPSSLQDVAKNIAQRYLPKKKDLIEAYVQDKFINIKGKLPLEGHMIQPDFMPGANGFDLKEDLQHTQAASFIALAAKQDTIMGWGSLEKYGFNTYNFATFLTETYVQHVKTDMLEAEKYKIDFTGKHGQCFVRSKTATKKFEEHLYNIGIMSKKNS